MPSLAAPFFPFAGFPVRRSFADRRDIRTAVLGEIDLRIADAVVLQRSMLAAGDADNRPQRIVRQSSNRQDLFSGLSSREQRRSDRMRTVDQSDPDERRFSAEDLRIDLFKRLASDVIVTVACRSSEAGVRNALRLKRLEYARRILQRTAVDLPEAVSKGFLGSFRKREKFG